VNDELWLRKITTNLSHYIPNTYREEKTWEIYALPESNINTDHEAWEWYRFSLLRVGCCKHGNEPLDSIKGRKFVD